MDKQKDKSNDSRLIQSLTHMISPLDVFSVQPFLPTIFNDLIAQLLTVTLPPSVDILAYADDLVLISHRSNSADKFQKSLNTVDKVAKSLGLYFSPAKTKRIAFNTTRQPKFTSAYNT